MEFLQKIKNRSLPYDPAISTPVYINKGNNRISNRHTHSCVHCSTTHYSHDMETT